MELKFKKTDSDAYLLTSLRLLPFMLKYSNEDAYRMCAEAIKIWRNE